MAGKTTTEPRLLPVTRELAFDPPPGTLTLPAIAPMLFPTGPPGWVVTSQELARAVLADPRMSARRENTQTPLRQATRTPRPGDERRRRGLFISMDPPEHTYYRRLLTGQFTVRRMRELEPRIEQIVAEHLDAMAAAGPGADLVAAFALPVPSLVICELLGVDYADRELFQATARALLDMTVAEEQMLAAADRMREFMLRLVRDKRAAPGDDLLSGLVTDTELDDDELASIGSLLLLAGHETTSNMLALGTFALLCHPEQMALLRGNPDGIAEAVEELLRYLSIIGFGMVRVALEDLTLGGVTVERGQTVVVALPNVNRDPAVAEDPDRLDLTRDRTHHLAFGHGIHQCLGQQLARVEMRIGFRRLVERFDSLRLAVPAAEVPLRSNMAIHGVHALPVTW